MFEAGSYTCSLSPALPLSAVVPSGLVSNVNQTENALYKTIQVTPWADLSSFMAVSVLEKRTSGR